jgi:hypothetical protein
VNVVPPDGQLAATHDVPWVYFWQAPAAHLPLVPQLAAPWSLHWPVGSAAPSGSAVHAPSDAGRLQAKQPAVQALLQQTPSAQKPLAHSSPRAHRLPRIFLPHEALRQTAGASHSPLPSQVSAQRCFSASQRKGAQSRAGGVSQPPAPQTPSGVQRLAAGSQPPGLQTVPVGYFWQAPAPSQ